MALRIPQTIPACDPNHTVTVCKLSGWKLARAKQVFFNTLVADVQERGGAEVQKDIQRLFEAKPEDASAVAEEVKKAKTDPLNGYDTRTLIEHGITAYDNQPLGASWIDDLDEDEIRFYAEAVLKLTKPALFQAVEEQEADTKNA